MTISHSFPQSLQAAVTVGLLKRPWKLLSAFLSRISNSNSVISYSLLCRRNCCSHYDAKHNKTGTYKYVYRNT